LTCFFIYLTTGPVFGVHGKLYLEATAPDPLNNLNNGSIVINSPLLATVTLGNSTGGYNGERVPFTESPTGWAFCITYRTHRFLGPFTSPPSSFVVREYIPSRGRFFRRTIDMKWKDNPAPITDIELIESDLCAGSITVSAITSGLITDGFEYSHELYDWYFNGSIVASNVYNHFENNSTVTLNLGAPVTNDFTIMVVAKNTYSGLGVTTCAQTSYTKSITLAETGTVSPTIFDRTSSSSTYCDQRNNGFYIQNPTSGVEYRWTYTAVPSQYSETSTGINMTSFYPNFRRLQNTIFKKVRELILPILGQLPILIIV